MKKILIIAAHPDDEILGCGGLIKKNIKKKNKIRILFLAEGVTSRFLKSEIKNVNVTKKSEQRNNNAILALNSLGVKKSEIFLSDNSKLIDGIASWWSVAHGYNHPHLVEAIINQAQKQAIQMARQIFTDNDSEDKLVDLIVRLSEKYNLKIPLSIKRKLSEPTFVEFLNDAIQEMPPQEYASLRPDKDEFDYADYILQLVIDDNYGDFVDIIKNNEAYEEFYDYIRDNFAHRILEAWIDEIGFDDY
jgi:hypothetical protein